jgi:hypothetical protein
MLNTTNPVSRATRILYMVICIIKIQYFNYSEHGTNYIEIWRLLCECCIVCNEFDVNIHAN